MCRPNKAAHKSKQTDAGDWEVLFSRQGDALKFSNHNQYQINMTASTDLGPDRLLDVREVPCSIKHGLIIQTFVDLKVGEHFILRNGHDPVPLRYQFEAEFPGAFTWEHIHNRSEDVAVKITKVKLVVGGLPKVVAGSCGHH
jgi:uncharacterized protein (DUF2249 family)